MKRLLALLNLLICLEMAMAPLVPSLKIIFTGMALAQDCPAGLVMDSKLNRCITSDSAAKTMNQLTACEGLSGENKERCFRDNAIAAKAEAERNGDMSEKSNLNSGTDTVNKFMTGAAIAIPFAMAIKAIGDKDNNITDSTCSAISYTALVAGAVALYVGDTMANVLHGDRLDNIENEWHRIIKGDPNEQDKDQKRVNATETQREAFEMLARKEDSLANAAKMKSYFFGAAALAFATSTGFAIWEVASGGAQASTCASNKKAAKAKADKAYNTRKLEEAKLNGASGGGGADKFKTPAQRMDDHPANGSWEESFNSASIDWQSEVMKQKHIANMQTANDLASFYILSKAVNLSHSSPSVDEYHSLKEFTVRSMEESPELLSYLKLISKVIMSNLNPLPDARADKRESDEGLKTGKYVDIALTAGLGGVAAGGAFGLIFQETAQTITTAPGRIVLGSIFTLWSGWMVKHTIEQTANSRNRAKHLRTLRDDFSDASNSLANCRSEDRNNPGKPDCYCYTAENQRNANRSNSQICQNLWGRHDLASGEYDSGGNPIPGCIDRSRQHDPKCVCRQSSKGCLKATPANLGALNLGSFRMLASNLSPIDEITHGQGGSVDPASMNAQAMRVMRANEQLLNTKDLTPLKTYRDNAGEKYAQKLAAIGANMGPLAGSRPNAPMTPAEAVAELEKDLADAKADVKALDVAGAVDIKAAPLPEFGLTEEGFNLQKGQIAEVMNQDLDYGQNDISTGKNIFETLSNRYQRSGMRRLFDEESPTKADGATSEMKK